jgi:hypothetical protein
MGLKGPDVYGSDEVCQVLGGISRQRLAAIRKDHPDFPAFTKLKIGRVYDGPLVRAWQEARTKPRRHAMYRFACSYRATGNLTRACRHVDITRTTGARWLRELGIPLPSERLDVNR